MKMFLVVLTLLFPVVVVEAATAFYRAPGNGWSYIALSKPSLLEDGVNGVRIYSPHFVYPPETAKKFHFFIQDAVTDDHDYISMEPTPGEMIGVGQFLAHRSFYDYVDHEHIGFDWSSGSRGLNTSTSFVKVLEIEYGADRLPTVLAVDFVQFEETWNKLPVDFTTENYSFGSFRYNSSIPLTTSIPEPASMFFMAVATPFFLRRKR